MIAVGRHLESPWVPGPSRVIKDGSVHHYFISNHSLHSNSPLAVSWTEQVTNENLFFYEEVGAVNVYGSKMFFPFHLISKMLHDVEGWK